MASPQIENGYTRIANEILEQAAKVNLNGTQFRLVLTVWRYTYGFGRKSHELSIAFLMESIGASRSQVARELSVLKKRNIIIEIGKGKGGANKLGFNKNYKEWADNAPNEVVPNPVSPNQGVSNPRPEVVPNQGTEVVSNPGPKKERTKEIYKDIYVQVIGHLNEKAGKRFSAKSQANRKLINGRMSEGRTLEDFLHVIDVKCEQWLDDPKMSEYLRPATLFSQTNFENYVNQKLQNDKVKAADPRDKEIELQKWMQAGGDPDEFDWST